MDVWEAMERGLASGVYFTTLKTHCAECGQPLTRTVTLRMDNDGPEPELSRLMHDKCRAEYLEYGE